MKYRAFLSDESFKTRARSGVYRDWVYRWINDRDSKVSWLRLFMEAPELWR